MAERLFQGFSKSLAAACKGFWVPSIPLTGHIVRGHAKTLRELLEIYVVYEPQALGIRGLNSISLSPVSLTAFNMNAARLASHDLATQDSTSGRKVICGVGVDKLTLGSSMSDTRYFIMG